MRASELYPSATSMGVISELPSATVRSFLKGVRTPSRVARVVTASIPVVCARRTATVFKDSASAFRRRIGPWYLPS
jgi:hypothetical protein